MLKRISVLVVDDSAFARAAVTRALEADPRIQVVGTAHDGVDALEKVKALRPSVVTLDVVMSRMDGLTALCRIMEECPTPTVMVSALTGGQTKATIKALEYGAVDFFLKPSMLRPVEAYGTTENLVSKVKLAARVDARALAARPRSPSPRRPVKFPAKRPPTSRQHMVVIGSSTGGPKALIEMLPALPGDIPAPLLLVQHMPPGFTASLAKLLDSMSSITVREAASGDTVRPGLALLAPGGYHMTVSRAGEVSLNNQPPVCGVRPAVDITMRSVANAYGRTAVGVVLTGTGFDGTEGAALIKNAGGKVLVEDESTCTVYGMPKSIVNAGNADKVVPLHDMADEVVAFCGGRPDTPARS